MELKDVELIEKLADQDSEIKALWDQHKSYETVIQKMEKKPYLSDTETQEVKELKKKKLAGKTKLHGLIDKYK